MSPDFVFLAAYIYRNGKRLRETKLDFAFSFLFLWSTLVLLLFLVHSDDYIYRESVTFAVLSKLKIMSYVE